MGCKVKANKRRPREREERETMSSDEWPECVKRFRELCGGAPASWAAQLVRRDDQSPRDAWERLALLQEIVEWLLTTIPPAQPPAEPAERRRHCDDCAYWHEHRSADGTIHWVNHDRCTHGYVYKSPWHCPDYQPREREERDDEDQC